MSNKINYSTIKLDNINKVFGYTYNNTVAREELAATVAGLEEAYSKAREAFEAGTPAEGVKAEAINGVLVITINGISLEEAKAREGRKAREAAKKRREEAETAARDLGLKDVYEEGYIPYLSGRVSEEEYLKKCFSFFTSNGVKETTEAQEANFYTAFLPLARVVGAKLQAARKMYDVREAATKEEKFLHFSLLFVAAVVNFLTSDSIGRFIKEAGYIRKVAAADYKREKGNAIYYAIEAEAARKAAAAAKAAATRAKAKAKADEEKAAKYREEAARKEAKEAAKKEAEKAAKAAAAGIDAKAKLHEEEVAAKEAEKAAKKKAAAKKAAETRKRKAAEKAAAADNQAA